MANVDVPRLFASDLIEGQLSGGLVERRWLLERVESALADDGCRCLLLTAQPGWGKTAFSAWFLHQRPDTLRYFIRQDSRRPLNSGGARAFLTAIGHQLATRRPELFTSDDVSISVHQVANGISEAGEVVGARIGELVASPFRAVAVRVVQEAGDVSGRLLGVDLERVVGDERLIPLPDLQDLALLDPAKALASLEPEARIVIVIDGLDELRYQLGTETVLDWLSASPEPPVNVRLVLTARPDDVLLDPLRRRQAGWLRELPLDEVVEEVTADLTEYARRAASAPAVRKLIIRRQQDAETVVRSVVSAASGNFLYLRTLFGAIEQAAAEIDAGDAAAAAATRRLEGLLSLGQLPHELDDLYALLLTLLRQEVGREHLSVAGDELGQDILLPAWDALYRPILGMLAVAREPVNAAQIRQLAGIRGDEGATISAIGRMRPFLLLQAGRYRLFHATMQAFLTGADTARDHPEFAVSGAAWHARVAGNALRHHQRDWTSAIDGYALAHVVAHLASAIEPEGFPGQLEQPTTELSRLLTSLDFVSEKVRRLGVDDLLADFRDAQSVISSTRVRELERLCELQAHHLRPRGRAVRPGFTATQLGWEALRVGFDDVASSVAAYLERCAPPQVIPLWTTGRTGHHLLGVIGRHDEGAVEALAVLPDGAVVSGGADGTVRVWNPGRPEDRSVELGRHDREVFTVAVLPDGRVVSGGGDGTVRLWDPGRPEVPGIVLGHRHSTVDAVAVLPDGRLVSGGDDGIVRLWDPGGPEDPGIELGRHGRRVGLVQGSMIPCGGVAAIAVLPDGRLVSGGGDGTVLLWDPNRPGELVGELGRHGGWEGAVRGTLPDGRLISGAGVAALTVLPDGRVVSAGGDGAVRLWDPATPGSPGTYLGRHDAAVLALAVLPDGRVVSGGSEGEGVVRVWDPATPGHMDAELGRHDGAVLTLAVLPDGRVISGSGDGRVRLWDPSPAGDQGTDEAPDPFENAVALLPDGHVVSQDDIGSADDNQMLWLWDPAQPSAPRTEIGMHSGNVSAVAAAAAGTVVTGGIDGVIRLWNLHRPGNPVAESRQHEMWVSALAILPDGRVVSGGGEGDGTIRLWDPAAPSDHGTELGWHDATVIALAVLPHGRVVSGGGDGAVRLWDPDRPADLGTELGRHDGEVRTVAVLPDGRVVSGGGDGAVRLWDPDRPADLGTELGRHDGEVCTVAVLPDGRVVSGGGDGAVRLWDPDRPADLGTELARHDGEVSTIARSSGGREIAVNSGRLTLFKILMA